VVGYVGRFAPSPTGPLHFGSLITAVASFADARAHSGAWLVRVEDLDPSRTVAHAASAILRILEEHALEWDGPALHQNTRDERYRETLSDLQRGGDIFFCTCSRKDVETFSVYPGTCRGRRAPPPRPHAVRIQVSDATFAFDDRIQGAFRQNLARDVGDFVIRRRDGPFAYQLAVVVDDIDQRVTHIVRGADLLDNTPRQLLLYERLGARVPTFAHIPVARERTGQKLSKHSSAAPLDRRTASANLHAALTLLGQSPPDELVHEPPHTVIAWAIAHWRIDRVPGIPALSDFVCI